MRFPTAAQARRDDGSLDLLAEQFHLDAAMITRDKDTTTHRRRNHDRRVAAQPIRLGKGAFDDDTKIAPVVIVGDAANAYQRLRGCGMYVILGQQHRHGIVLAAGKIKHGATDRPGVFGRLAPFAAGLGSIFRELFHNIVRQRHTGLQLLW